MKKYTRKCQNDTFESGGSKKKNAPTKINCSKCGIEKELIFENFYKNKNKKTGFESQCKECQKKNDASWYTDNKQRISKDKKRYYQLNKEKIKARQREYSKSKEALL